MREKIEFFSYWLIFFASGFNTHSIELFHLTNEIKVQNESARGDSRSPSGSF